MFDKLLQPIANKLMKGEPKCMWTEEIALETLKFAIQWIAGKFHERSYAGKYRSFSNKQPSHRFQRELRTKNLPFVPLRFSIAIRTIYQGARTL